MNSVSEKGADFIRDLGDAARKNPVSAALIGMGILWLFTGNRPVERASDFVRTGLDRIPDAAGDAFDAARSTLRSGSDAIGERVASAKDVMRDGASGALDNAARYSREYADAASEYVSSVPGAGAEIFDTVRSNLSDVFRAQPLALGAIGLAIGAGIAAALPATELEADYLGETSDTVKAKATEFAEETADRVTKVAGNALEAAAQEAQQQGLTLEGAKSTAGDISAKVGRIVETAGNSISERTKLKTP
jgi:ElaB/YqjD/DUF883 family membrane-anchored ribosome-binding protein